MFLDTFTIIYVLKSLNFYDSVYTLDAAAANRFRKSGGVVASLSLASQDIEFEAESDSKVVIIAPSFLIRETVADTFIRTPPVGSFENCATRDTSLLDRFLPRVVLLLNFDILHLR